MEKLKKLLEEKKKIKPVFWIAGIAILSVLPYSQSQNQISSLVLTGIYFFIGYLIFNSIHFLHFKKPRKYFIFFTIFESFLVLACIYLYKILSTELIDELIISFTILCAFSFLNLKYFGNLSEKYTHSVLK